MNRRRTMRATTATILWVAALPLQAEAGCRDELAKVDARLATADLGPTAAALRQMRDQAATLCGQGQEAMASQILGILEASLPATEAETAAKQQADADSKAALTDGFLAGVWCSMTGEERSQLVFSEDGTYRFCLNDTVLGPYGRCSPEPLSTADWLAGYPRAKSVERDTIVLSGRGRHQDFTFKRGACSRYGR